MSAPDGWGESKGEGLHARLRAQIKRPRPKYYLLNITTITDNFEILLSKENVLVLN